MLSALVVVLLAVWCVGLLTSYTFGGLIHIFLVAACVALLLRIMQGRGPARDW